MIAHGVWFGQTKQRQTNKQTNSARLSVGKWLKPQKDQEQAGWGAEEITAVTPRG